MISAFPVELFVIMVSAGKYVVSTKKVNVYGAIPANTSTTVAWIDTWSISRKLGDGMGNTTCDCTIEEMGESGAIERGYYL